MGLSGVGDLVLTATGDLSRNRRVGLLLAQGQTLAQAVGGGGAGGGVGTAIAASLAAAGLADLGLFDLKTSSADALARRLRAHYPQLLMTTGSRDPDGYDLVVNATPMGMNEGDELPVDVTRLVPTTFVGEVVMRTEMTAFLKAAQALGCPVQVGSDMLFEQIPAYLEFFGLPSTTPDVLRSVARLHY